MHNLFLWPSFLFDVGRLSCLNQLCAQAHLNCVPECEPGAVVTWVGLEIDFAASTYRLTSKWCQKVRPILDLVSWHAQTSTPLVSSVYQKFVGICTYACYIQRQPMMLMSPLFGCLDSNPTAMVSLSSVASYLEAPYQLLSLGSLPLAPPFKHTRKAGQPLLFTDASGYAAGYHVEWGEVRPPWQRTFYFSSDELDLHITAKELLAVLKTFQDPRIAQLFRNTRVLLFCDSTVVVHALRKWYSPSLALNNLLVSLAQCVLGLGITLDIEWVPTWANPADRPSRPRE